MVRLGTFRGRLRDFWGLLWPDYSRVDPGFYVELQERSVLGLRIVSTVIIALTMIMITALWLLGSGERPLEESSAVALGLAGLLLSRTSWGARHARGLAILVGYVAGLIVLLHMAAAPEGHASTVYVALVIINLVMVAVVPMRPLGAFGFGFGLTGMFALSALFDPSVGWPPAMTWLERLVLLFAVALLSGGLLIVITRLHVQEHESRASLSESLEALRRTQAGLIESKRAASQGRLAAALSHEMNNPLSVVLSNEGLISRHLAALCRKFGDDESVAQLVSSAQEAAGASRAALERISSVVERFQRFSNLDTAERRKLNVNELLDDVIGVLSGSWDNGVRVVKDYGELPELVVSPTRLTEVFRNLLSNAANAIDGSGEIRVSTRYARGYVWVQIADTGRGIETDELGSIFEPGFRVADGRVSTGWGLFISRQIVHDQGGEFHISSEPGQGTQVEVCLPIGLTENG